MQPTRRPWSGWTWESWPVLGAGEREARRGARARGRRPARPPPPPPAPDLRRDWRLRQDIPHNAFYSPKQIRHLIRWEAALGVPTLPPSWMRDPGRPWRLNDITVFTHAKPPPRPTYTVSVSGVAPGPGPGDEGPGWWEGAARGLPLGAALLAALLLLVRAADKCLHTNLFKLPLPLRRRPRLQHADPDEWPTPSVLATNLSVRITGECESEPPPPYAACARKAGPGPGPGAAEEPPPPYSACYVTYSHTSDTAAAPPQAPAPAVRLYPSSLRYGYEEGRSGLLDDDPALRINHTQDEPPPDFDNGDHLRIEVGGAGAGAGVMQRVHATGLDINYNPIPADDIPAVHTVFPPRDGTDSRGRNADFDSVVVVKKQRDHFLTL